MRRGPAAPQIIRPGSLNHSGYIPGCPSRVRIGDKERTHDPTPRFRPRGGPSSDHRRLLPPGRSRCHQQGSTATHRRYPRGRGHCPADCCRRRMLLGPSGHVRARAGRDQGRRRLLRQRGETAHYEMVGTETTGHAESVQITFDPRWFLRPALAVVLQRGARPTELNRQGRIPALSYRSEIFFSSPTQEKVARAPRRPAHQAQSFSAPIVTQDRALQGSYPAEDYIPPGFSDPQSDASVHRDV